MNILYTLLITIGLIVVNPSIHGLTPQAANKMVALEADLNGKYAIVKELNDASKGSSEKRKAFKKGTYSLSIESIEKLRDEISSDVAQIIALDNAYGNTKIAARDENFKTMNEWVSDGKIGSEKTIRLGDSKEELTGISQLQHPIMIIIDTLKKLTSSDANYNSEIDLLSASLDRYRQEVSAYDKGIDAQYPRVGFETKQIFLGVNKMNPEKHEFVFTDLKNSIDAVAKKLEGAKDSKGVLLTTQTSKWNEFKPVGERIKEQITKIKTDGTKEMHDAIIKIAKESAATHELSGADSPWIYAEKHLFIPFLKISPDITMPTALEANTKGSFAYIKSKQNEEAKSLTDMLLITDADKAITSYLELDPTIINNADNKKELQKFASTYARITAEALNYALMLHAKDSTIHDHSELYNTIIMKNSYQLKQSFTQFYKKHKDLLALDAVEIKFSSEVLDLAEITKIQGTADWIKTANPVKFE